jgi:hypothetical protein
MTDNHIAQVNIAPMLAPLDDPIMADFVANLDPINALADAAPGFVWRLKSDEGNATAIRVFENDMIIINMSVWESIDALYQYTYFTDHAGIFRRRAEWFTRLGKPSFALWHIPAGSEPTAQDARARLEFLQAHGPTPYAFTFKQRFTPDEARAYSAVTSRA